MNRENDKPIRIAQIIGKWVGGGVEAVVMNYYRHIDHNKIQFDFICDEDSTNIPYEEIEKLGGRVILIPPYQKVFKYHKRLKKVLQEGNYKIVHSHINTLSVFSLFAAKCAKVPVRIAHSHSTTNKKEWKKNLIKLLLRPFAKSFATNYMACTEHAGRWMFGNKEFDKSNVYVLNNAIDLDKFAYNEKIREEKRKEIGIEDNTLVIGHIGRFVEQKNHKFLIEVFNEFHKKEKNSVLVLVGQGPLQEEIKEKVKDLGIQDSVKFLGQRADANEIYQAFDVFLLPSLYEGLGMVAIEAQTAGCMCIVSTEVPSVAKVSEKIIFLNLNDKIDNWVHEIDKYKNKERNIDINQIKRFGYDIKSESVLLEKYYQKKTSRSSLELFGSPGSGKTTLCNKMQKEDESIVNLNRKYLYGARIKRILTKFYYTFCIKLKYRELSHKLDHIVNIFEFTDKKVKLKMKLYLYSTIYLIKDKKTENYVLEEGITQVLWAFCYNSKNYEDNIKIFVDELINLFNDKILYLDIDEKTLIERLNERNQKGGSELEHDIKNNKDKILLAKKIEKDIILYLKENTKIEVIK